MTQENNELIAKWMGWVYRSDPFNDWFVDGIPLGKNLQFHSSWNWLMPVVEKIGDLYLDFPGRVSDFMRMSIGTPIDEVYKAVVEFIRWFNETKIKTDASLG